MPWPIEKPRAPGFLERVLYALEVDEVALAALLGVRVKEIRKLETLDRGTLIEINRDIIWTILSDHVDERIGKLISIREEMSRKLSGDRKRQITQRLRIKGRW